MRYIVLLSTLLLSVSSFAKDRTFSEMRTLALGVYQKAANSSSSAAKAKAVASASLNDVTLEKECKEYSIFTMNDTGFVIVSKDADDNPILGYSTSNTSSDDMPAALKKYLEAYDNADVHEIHQMSRNVSAIAPFVTTKWGQDAPFNDLCPVINNKKTPCGCGATAISQILNYMQLPKSFAFSSTYTVGEDATIYNVTVKDSLSFPYLDSYAKGTYTEAQGNAVATFVRDCGYAINMNYTTSGSGAYANAVMTAAIARFGFPKEAIKLYEKSIYSSEEWDDIIFGELEKGYPIYYTGNDANGNNGHAFVVCGCDDQGDVYVNWGWDGSYDGYFSMSLLNPASNNFSYGTTTIQGFHPEKLDTDVQEIVFGAPGLYTISVTDATKMNVNLPQGLWNYSNASYTVNICAQIENVETGTKKYSNVTKQSVTYPTYYGEGAGDYSFTVSSLEEGKYHISLVACKSGRPTSTYIPVRTKGGIIYYDLTVDANGNRTIGTTPIPAGINAITVENPATSTKAYNIAGQQVNDNYKGIKIQNGRKVICK